MLTCSWQFLNIASIIFRQLNRSAHPTISGTMPSYPAELDYKAESSCNLLSQTINMVANEPSMGLYRIQEHCRKSSRDLVAAKLMIMRTDKATQGAYYDADYAIGAVNDFADARANIAESQSTVEKAIELKRLINSWKWKNDIHIQFNLLFRCIVDYTFVCFSRNK